MTRYHKITTEFWRKLNTKHHPYDMPSIKSDFAELTAQIQDGFVDNEFMEFCHHLVENRIKRVVRLIELDAPIQIIDKEFRWCTRCAERLMLACIGEDWQLSASEKEELEILRSIDEACSDDEDERK